MVWEPLTVMTVTDRQSSAHDGHDGQTQFVCLIAHKRDRRTSSEFVEYLINMYTRGLCSNIRKKT